MAKNSAPAESAQGGARTAFTEEQLAHIKATLLEKIPQGWTIRQVLAEPDMCSMTYLYRDLLPHDEDFSKQYARAFELRNEYWADELVEIADDGTNDWVERTFGRKTVTVFNKEAAERSKIRKWLMGESQPKKYGEKVDVNHTADKESPPVFTLKIDNG